ncbi:unnamed protein product [Peniophora sp. CBMAI 1063]|nr:unnamed protein product [Peniophora sp. CBMAI 1063]
MQNDIRRDPDGHAPGEVHHADGAHLRCLPRGGLCGVVRGVVLGEERLGDRADVVDVCTRLTKTRRTSTNAQARLVLLPPHASTRARLLARLGKMSRREEQNSNDSWTPLAQVRIVPRRPDESKTEGEARMAEDISRLEDALIHAKRMYNYHYSPIYVLPDETLLEIFHFARAYAHRKADDRRTIGPIVQWMKSVTHLSHRLRRISVNASSLWDQLHIHEPDPWSNLLGVHLARSRTRDLHLHFAGVPEIIQYLRRIYPEHMRRVRTVTLEYEEEDTEELPPWYIDEYLHFLPNLSSLTISCTTPDERAIPLETSTGHPALSSLVLQRCFLSHTACICQNLVSLRIEDAIVSEEHYVPIISGTKALRELVLARVCLVEDAEPFTVPLPECLERLEVTVSTYYTIRCFQTLAPSPNARVTTRYTAPPADWHTPDALLNTPSLEESYTSILRTWLGYGRGPAVCSVSSRYNSVALDTQLRMWRGVPNRIDLSVPDVEVVLYTDEDDTLSELLKGPEYGMTTDLYLDLEYNIASAACWEELETVIMPALRTLHVAETTLEDTLPHYSVFVTTFFEGAPRMRAWPPVLHVESSPCRSAQEIDKAAGTLREWLALTYRRGLFLEEIRLPKEIGTAMDALEAETRELANVQCWRGVAEVVQLY